MSRSSRAAQPAQAEGVRHPAEARARPELPHRLEHPRRHRARGATCTPTTSCLEIGGGLGVLSEHLAARARHVHVVELDRSLEPALQRRARPAPEHDAPPRGRARHRPAPALDPRADEGRRQPALRHRRDGDPPHASRSCRTATRWVAMVQREVGERFAAGAGQRRVRRARACSPSSSCDVQGAAPRRAHRLPPRPERRLGPRRARRGPGRPRAEPRARRVVQGGVRAPPQGAAALARAGGRGAARDEAARRAASARPRDGHPRRAPDARGLPRARGGAARDRGRTGEDQPLPLRRTDPRGRPARAGQRDGVDQPHRHAAARGARRRRRRGRLRTASRTRS